MFLEKEIKKYLNWFPSPGPLEDASSSTFSFASRICYFRIKIAYQGFRVDIMSMSTDFGFHESIIYLGNFFSLEDAMENAESYYQLRLRGK